MEDKSYFGGGLHKKEIRNQYHYKVSGLFISTGYFYITMFSTKKALADARPFTYTYVLLVGLNQYYRKSQAAARVSNM